MFAATVFYFADQAIVEIGLESFFERSFFDSCKQNWVKRKAVVWL